MGTLIVTHPDINTIVGHDAGSVMWETTLCTIQIACSHHFSREIINEQIFWGGWVVILLVVILSWRIWLLLALLTGSTTLVQFKKKIVCVCVCVCVFLPLIPAALVKTQWEKE